MKKFERFDNIYDLKIDETCDICNESLSGYIEFYVYEIQKTSMSYRQGFIHFHCLEKILKKGLKWEQ
jgi:hypothetical protein